MEHMLTGRKRSCQVHQELQRRLLLAATIRSTLDLISSDNACAGYDVEGFNSYRRALDPHFVLGNELMQTLFEPENGSNVPAMDRKVLLEPRKKRPHLIMGLGMGGYGVERSMKQ